MKNGNKGMPKKNKRIYFAIGIILLLGTTYFSAVYPEFANYMKNRGNDLADCFMLKAGYGTGISGYVRVTKYGPTMYAGFSESNFYGFVGRNWCESEEFTVGIAVLGLHGVTVEPHSLAFYPTPGPCVILSDFNFLIIPGTYLLHEKIVPASAYYWIEANLLVFIGLSIGFNPYEFVDLLFGLVGFDIASDDNFPLTDEAKSITSFVVSLLVLIFVVYVFMKSYIRRLYNEKK